MNAPIRRKPTNLSLQENLVAEAKALGLNVSQIAEAALAAAVREAKAAAWLAENREAIEAYNRHVEQHGMFIDDIRSL
ncbi:type II toxin-antitoxin system CcdA family antitoxin [Ferrovibrio sp.]|uniref:type II toxin-antitoxin system CcdA family antitoxin n=1 Tax=Ferrovibrio sp. TaxID=1917215 RepID=UPI001B681402|nr:type II toxin-antitoxin system CcdA family antitoxin [Ferrovibrio sp.]MBP7062973.1 type II toxin-antitoxin system CcdA family antitoxin [Ferrovibrio sp.]